MLFIKCNNIILYKQIIGQYAGSFRDDVIGMKYIAVFKRNIVYVLNIEILALFMYTYVIFPACQMLLEKVMASQGYWYFIDDNIMAGVKNILILLTLLFIAIILGLCFYFEIIILINTLSSENHTLITILKKSLHSLRKLFSPFGILLAIISFFTGIIMHLNLLARILENLGLIRHIRLYFSNHKELILPAFLVLLALLYIILRYLFVYSLLAGEDMSVKKAYGLSAKLMKNRYLNSAFVMFKSNAAALVIFMVLYLIAMFASLLIIRNNEIVRLQYAVSMTVMDTINRLLLFFYSIAIVIVNLETVLFLKRKYDIRDEQTGLRQTKPASGQKKKPGILKVTLTLAVLCSMVLFILINDDFLHNFRLQTGYDPEGRKPEIIAHRGNAFSAPENTLAALISAMEEKADCAEIDVRLTKDEVPVLMHDSSLLRTCGINKEISKLTYSQLSGLDAGSWFSPAFKGEKIPTLLEALELCKDNMALMIEVKTDNDNERIIAQRVVENIEEMDMEQDVIVASFNINVLKEVKELNEAIATCLILRVAYGNVENMEEVDIFSIESSFIQKSVIRNIKKSGKALAVWNVNDSRRLASISDMDVDMVITRRPVMAREMFYEDVVPGFLNKLIISFLK